MNDLLAGTDKQLHFVISLLVEIIFSVVIFNLSEKNKACDAILGSLGIAFMFGVQVKTVEKNGYENTNIVHKEPAFIPMDKAMEYLG